MLKKFEHRLPFLAGAMNILKGQALQAMTIWALPRRATLRWASVMIAMEQSFKAL